jgi:hypothetical protein
MAGKKAYVDLIQSDHKEGSTQKFSKKRILSSQRFRSLQHQPLGTVGRFLFRIMSGPAPGVLPGYLNKEKGKKN